MTYFLETLSILTFESFERRECVFIMLWIRNNPLEYFMDVGFKWRNMGIYQNALMKSLKIYPIVDTTDLAIRRVSLQLIRAHL